MADRVGPAVGRHPRPLADPLLITGPATEPGAFEDLSLTVIDRWAAPTGDAHTGKLAPSAIEVVRCGGVVDRRVDLGWSDRCTSPTVRRSE